MEHFPASVVALTGQFAPYSMANNFIYFQAFMPAYMLTGRTRKTVTDMGRVCFFPDRHVSGMERFLHRYQWDLTGIRNCLVNLIQTRLKDGLSVHGSYLLRIDTFLISRVRGKMTGVQKWHDHSGNPDRGDHMIGHHRAVAGLIGFGPVGNQFLPRAFPALTRPVSGQLNPMGFVVDPLGGARLMTFWDTVCPMILQLQGMPGHQPVRVVADACFSKAPFINRMSDEGVHVISRMRYDGVGREDPEPVSGNGKKRRGPKPKHPLKGRKRKSADLLTRFPQQTVTVSLYGKVKNLRVVCRDLRITGVESRRVRIAVIETKGQPYIPVSTDMLLTPLQIIGIYGRRFMGEMVIRDLKQHFGIGDYQCTGILSALRYAGLAVVGFCLRRLILIDGQNDWIQTMEKTGSLSFSRVSKSLRGYVTEQVFHKFAQDADFHNSYSVPDELIRMIVS